MLTTLSKKDLHKSYLIYEFSVQEKYSGLKP